MIGNDVWVGKNVTVCSGVAVHDGAVLGAGSVVTGDVPAYAIVVGSPANVIRYRFDDQVRESLVELRWWDLDETLLRSLPYTDIHKCIEELKNLRSSKCIVDQ